MGIQDVRALRPLVAGVTVLALAAAGVMSLGAGVAGAQAPRASAAVSSGAPVVGTGDGPVRGVAEDDVTAFRGIPYAAPPVGDLRFKAPRDPEPWTEPRDATEFGPACAQEDDEAELAEGGSISEDCLTLNVWSRSLDGDDPVIVFIHGGGFTSGTASNDWYDGADLARRGATVVSIQYRIGPFGWLDVSDLGPEYAQSMNNGLKDQMAALEWVRENIDAFGGDAQNVTVTGESAGAISISALMGVPEADDLYDRVIVQSGTAGTVATRQWAADVADAFIEEAGADSAADLLDLDTEQMLHAANEVYSSQFSDTAFHPVVDGTLLPELPSERIASPDGPTAPVIIGTTLDEARYWYYYLPEIERLPLVYSRPWLESLVGDRADEVVDAYRIDRPELDDAQLQLAMIGDVGFRMPAIRMAEALSARGVDTRMYLATVPAIDLDGIMGSPHAVELPFVFGTTDAASTFVADDPANRRLSNQVQDLWVSFAQGETPTSAGTTWPQYDEDERATMILDTDLRVENDPYAGARQAWGDLTFNGAEPGLDRLTPLQFEGTNEYDPRVIAAVIGWGWIWTGVAVLLALAAGVVLLVRRRRRTGVNRGAGGRSSSPAGRS
jgi:para-nitrobenzyl esterase